MHVNVVGLLLRIKVANGISWMPEHGYCAIFTRRRRTPVLVKEGPE
jgi:hypothetical protein